MKEKINEFIIFCIEVYKEKEDKTGKEIYNLFKEHDVFAFLEEHYDVLHTQGKAYIVETITDFIENKEI